MRALSRVGLQLHIFFNVTNGGRVIHYNAQLLDNETNIAKDDNDNAAFGTPLKTQQFVHP